MTEERSGRDEAARASGDEVEAAGETTAAAVAGGSAEDGRAVGADTQVMVEGDAHPADG